MRLPKRTVNPGLAALIHGGGFRSLERFAVAVNERGWETSGVKLAYDHISVKRWLTGSVCQNPEVVAAVLSEAWGVPVPVQAIWPELRDGRGPVPAHLQTWVAARTLEDLGAFIGSDMLSRREVLAGSIGVVTGPALVDPLTRWLGVDAAGVPARTDGTERIGASQVEGIERATARFASLDAEVGGGLSREAAVGQLKYAVDLVRYSSYSDVIGNRLLAAVAELSGVVGWMCQDSGMRGPAQRYLLYGLQAAKESSDPRAPLLVIGILRDLARHAHWAGDPATALRVLDVAVNQLPGERSRLSSLRAVLWSNKAWALASLGASGQPEARNALGLAADLQAHASNDDRATALRVLHEMPSAQPAALDAQLAITASCTYLTMAQHDERMAGAAQTQAVDAVTRAAGAPGRHALMAQIRLSRARFAAGEPDQGCDDGDQALALTGDSMSTMVTTRLRELLGDTEPHRERPRVREFRERLRGTLRG
jgi:hypothetical protein